MNSQDIRKLLEDKEIAIHKKLDIIKKSLDDDGKIQILHNLDFILENRIEDFEIQEIISLLSDAKKQEVLLDKVFVQQELRLKDYQVLRLVVSLESEESKLKMIELYNFKDYQIANILETFSDKSKISIVLENPYEIDKDYLKQIISSLSVDTLVDFIKKNKQFLVQNNIKVYKITQSLDKEKQLYFVSKIEDMGLSIEEKKQILVKLSEEAKSEIDISKLPPEYATAIEIKTMEDLSDIKDINAYGKIIIDFKKDLEIYRGLDELIYINPMEISATDRQKFRQLCEICPKMNINDNILLGQSTVEEYRNGEIWIESILQGMDEGWSDIQKVAFIDYAIGKKISYTPDFDTEVFDQNGARALWKIIDSGYGVCNGIAQVEQYILSRIGIDAEMVSSDGHSFLKLKNIELPNSDGGMTTGDTILDPTWNLKAHRYGAKPENFCRSYTEIRKHDIKDDGSDTESHKNDEDLASATLDLDEKSLRRIFTSIGLADRDGNFPIKALRDESKTIDDYRFPEEESIKQQFSLLAKYCPEFATCQNSTMWILQGVILNQENLKFNKCVANRVYARDDKSKSPVLYVYVDFPQSGKKFYFADKDIGQFVELSQKEFEARFECYERDMEKNDGHRPWEDLDRTEHLEDLTQSSEKAVASEGDER